MSAKANQRQTLPHDGGGRDTLRAAGAQGRHPVKAAAQSVPDVQNIVDDLRHCGVALQSISRCRGRRSGKRIAAQDHERWMASNPGQEPLGDPPVRFRAGGYSTPIEHGSYQGMSVNFNQFGNNLFLI
jgi:hypothetical protein